MERQKQKRFLWIAIACLVVLMAAFATIYALTQPETSVGAKTITISVVVPDEDPQLFTIHTDEEYLRGALEQEDLVSGSESEYGLYVETVSGIKVDSEKNEWWCFTQDGETLLTGVDTTPIEDGDSFEITLSTY